MRNINEWRQSKFVFYKGRLRASRDQNEVQVSSRLMVDLIAEIYDSAIKEHVKGVLIDLGCGKVPLYASYRDYISKNICVDWINTTHKNKYLDKQCDLTKKLPFNNNVFDTIILSDVLEHIPNPDNLIEEMNRILKQGGKVLLNVPFYYWIHEVPFDFYRYTEFALIRFANNANFKIIELKAIGGYPEIIADILAKSSVNVKIIGKPFASLIQIVIYHFVKNTKIGRKISKNSSANFPFGYFMVLEKK